MPGAPARAETAARGAPDAACRSPISGIGCAIPTPSMRSTFCGCRGSIRSTRPLGAADRGSFIHAAIGDFARIYAGGLPADPCGELLRLGEMHFAQLKDFPEARAFWWPRYERIASWFAAFEQERRAGIVAALAEIRGEMPIPTPSGSGFRLIGRADRIERLADGRYAILDFKTGKPPTSPQVRSGLAPQLTLEAAMLRGGGFAGIAATARSPSLPMSGSRAASRPASDAPSISKARRSMPRPMRRCKNSAPSSFLR